MGVRPSDEEVAYEPSRRASHPASAPSASPTSGARGTSVVTLTRIPSASPTTAPSAIATPTLMARIQPEAVDKAHDTRFSMARLAFPPSGDLWGTRARRPKPLMQLSSLSAKARRIAVGQRSRDRRQHHPAQEPLAVVPLD